MITQQQIRNYNFFLKGEQVTPQVSIDDERNELIFSGRCSPEMAINFYKPIEDAIDRYFQQGKKELIGHFNMEYINTSSTKCIINLMRRLDKRVPAGIHIELNWYYEEDDIDMMETGEDLSDLLSNVEINLIEFPEDTEVQYISSREVVRSISA